jgi:formate-dependent nitrite reductase membrane component NrfD
VDIQVLYNTHHEIPLGVLLAIYFYLTGLSAGSFVVSVIAVIGGKAEYKPIGRIGAVVAPIALLIAPLCLMLDLEQPFRFWHLYFYLNPQSPITYGSFLLTIYPINGIIYAWFLFKGNQKWSRLLGIIGIPLAICTHGYTGFILALGKGRALWSTALMPTLFIVSAVVSGLALVIVLAAIRWKVQGDRMPPEDSERDFQLILGLGKFLVGAVCFDLFLVANDILVLITATAEELHVAHLILAGRFAPLFVGVELFLGGIIPLIVLLTPRTGRTLRGVVTAAILTLIGVYAMRVVVVIAGQALPLH